tara:strand:- start:1388 stop:2314 length:927 start_codon:yes stop_codon:yes gene_type:complete
MCRLLGYLGDDLQVSALITDSDSSLTRQATDSSVQNFMNVAGTGFKAWENGSIYEDEPYTYKSIELPMYDRTLMGLTKKLKANCVLGHIRATVYGNLSLVNTTNVHPFQFTGTKIALAHNGGLTDFPKMKFALAAKCKPEIANKVEGTTDSEWIYALFLSMLDDPFANHSSEEIANAASKTIQEIKTLRDQFHIDTHSVINLIISNGKSMIATCFTYDFGCYEGIVSPAVLSPQMHSLWYTAGDKFGEHDGNWAMSDGNNDGTSTSIIIASEPLTRNDSSWFEIQKYSMAVIDRIDGKIKVDIRDLGI